MILCPLESSWPTVGQAQLEWNQSAQVSVLQGPRGWGWMGLWGLPWEEPVLTGKAQ